MSDKLKLFEQMCEPDRRQSFFAVFEGASFRKSTLEDLYQEVSEFVLHPSVPEAIQINFDTARNIMLYSWFVYRFMPVAELQACSSLELALRIKFGLEHAEHAPTLAGLLKKAIEEKLVSDIQIKTHQRIAKRREEFIQSQRRFLEVLGQSAPEPPPSDPQGYCKILWDTFPSLRNDLAHGSNTLSPTRAFVTLEVCCDLINQLFP